MLSTFLGTSPSGELTLKQIEEAEQVGVASAMAHQVGRILAENLTVDESIDRNERILRADEDGVERTSCGRPVSLRP